MVLPASAATVQHADAIVCLTADKEKVSVGDEVTITVKYKNIPECSSVDLALVYDTEYLQETTEANIKKNVSGKPWAVANGAAILESKFSEELAGRTAAKVVAAQDTNCLNGSYLFEAKFVVKKDAPAPGIPFEFAGKFINLHSEKEMSSTIEVANIHIPTVNPTASVTSVTLAKAPTKTQYVQGQALNLDGGRLLVQYSDNTSKEVHLSLAEITQYEFNKLGTQTVKAKYADIEVSFEIQTEASTLSSISVGKTPDTIEYIKGTSSLDMSGVLLLHYSGGVVKTVDMADSSVVVSGYQPNTMGIQTLQVSYKGFTTEYKITVVEKHTKEIDVRTPMVCSACGADNLDPFKLIRAANSSADPYSMNFNERQEYIKDAANNVTCLVDGCEGKRFTTKMKMEYFLHQPFDAENASLFVTYEDNTPDLIPMTLDMVEFKNNVATTQDIKVIYGKQWTTIDGVKFRKKEATEITISKYPDKMTYIIGDSFSSVGGKINVKFDDGSEEEFSMGSSDVSITHDGLNARGSHKITVRYDSKKTTFYVQVVDRAVEKIEIDPSAKFTYLQGEELDLDTKLKVTYNDGDVETAYLRDAAVSGYDPEIIGVQRVKVTYGKVECEWQVTVEERPPVNVETLEIIGKLPTTVLEGLEPELDDCTLKATYENGEVEEDIEIEFSMIRFDEENGVVYIAYKNKTISFEIEIIEKSAIMIQIAGTLPSTLLEGRELNFDGCTLTVFYNNGEVKRGIPITSAMIFYNKQVGERQVTISYEGKTAKFTIVILEKSAKEIKVTTLPQTDYLEGVDTALNLAGGKLTIFYDNDTEQVIDLSQADVSGFDKTHIGTQKMTVNYQGMTAHFYITMKKKEIVTISLAAMPTKTVYRQGVEAFAAAGGKINVFYNNGTKETVDLSAATIRGFSNLFAGNVTITAAYKDFALQLTVLILAENPFKDVKVNEYYEIPVLWAVTKKITTGTAQDSFSPDDTCTRGQIVTFLWRAAGEPIPQSTKNPFNDVSKDAYYYKAVLWAVEQGITTGTSANTFSPDAACTRGQVATFLWRAAGKPAPQSAKNVFTDVKSGEYYSNAVLWAVEQGITIGVGDNLFAPETTCTRGHIVTFLYRANT